MQESFDPIIDVPSGLDLLPKMVYAETVGDWDFQGVYSVLLRHRCVCVISSSRGLASTPASAAAGAWREKGA